METEASPPSPLSSLRDRLRAMVCCCFGYGGGGGGGVGAPGEFRYDPLSYALNFDEGFDEDYEEAGDHHHADGLLYRSFSSRLPPSAVAVVEPPAAPKLRSVA